VASKSAYGDAERGLEIEDALTALDKHVDRLRVMYEQYFMGILKQPPSHLHRDAERKIRDLTQLQIRNTGLRYRFATLTQKFGSYNTYWRRILRQIEQGRYVRDLSRIKRRAAQRGEDIPEEILAAMPKRMREMVARDRDAAVAAAERRGQVPGDEAAAEGAEAAVVHSKAPRKRVYTLEMPDDLDVDAMFDDITGVGEAEKAAAAPAASGPAPGAPVVPAAATARGKPQAREAHDTIPTPMQFPAFDEEAPTGLRTRAETAPPVPPVKPPPPPAGGVPKRTMQMPPPRPPGRPRATAPPKPSARVAPAAPPPGMTEADTRSLYAKFVKARQLVGEKNDDMTYDKLMRTLRQQGTKIMAQYKAKGVEFGVVIKNNKVVLKAKPKA
jgi:hypothetical protein